MRPVGPLPKRPTATLITSKLSSVSFRPDPKRIWIQFQFKSLGFQVDVLKDYVSSIMELGFGEANRHYGPCSVDSSHQACGLRTAAAGLRVLAIALFSPFPRNESNEQLVPNPQLILLWRLAGKWLPGEPPLLLIPREGRRKAHLDYELCFWHCGVLIPFRNQHSQFGSVRFRRGQAGWDFHGCLQ